VTKQEIEALVEAVSDHSDGNIKVRAIFPKMSEGILVLSGEVTPAVTDSDPIAEGRDINRVMPVEARAEASRTASILNYYLRSVYRTLEDHPVNVDRRNQGKPTANALITQRPGKEHKLDSMQDKWGLRGLSVASAPVYWGLATMLGMDSEKVKDTGDAEKDLRDRLRLAHEAKEYDFVHVHTKRPDEAGHTKAPIRKKEVIEALDRAMDLAVEEIASDPETLIVITADHSTASSGTMVHTGETVPLTMVGKYVRRDKVTTFDEIEAARGALGLVRGKELMYLILNFLDRAKMQGLMDTPIDQPYYPGRSQPLLLEG
jgi:2,3-bisphosphoglycerate-independent phosphoglycerate mutase